MSGVAAHKVSADYIYTIERQAAWGTAIDTAPIGLPSADMEITLDPGNITIPRHSGSRGETEGQSYNDSSLMIPKAKLSCPATPYLLTLLMPAVLQKNADYAAASNVWTYLTYQRADLPNCRDEDEGYFYTLTMRSPVASDSVRLTDAICTTLKLSLSPDAHDGLLWIDAEFIGTAYTDVANPSASVTQASLASLYRWIDLDTVTIGGNSMTADFISMEIDITCGAKFRNDVPTGETVFPEWNVTGKFAVAPNANTKTVKGLCYTAAVSTGVATTLVWGDGTESETGEMTLTHFHKFISPDPQTERDDQITFATKGLFGGAGEYPFMSEHFYSAA